MLELAKQVCKKAHADQFDKGGKPYYLHPFAVAEKCDTEQTKIAAYLHDVLEDTEITVGELLQMGFDHEVVEAVIVLTKRSGQDYDEYIENVKNNPIARVVKLNDMRHNSDLSRLKTITEKDLSRVEKYKRNIEYLSC